MLIFQHLNKIFTLCFFCLLFSKTTKANPSRDTVDFLTQHIKSIGPQYHIKCPTLLKSNYKEAREKRREKPKETLSMKLLPLKEDTPVFFQEIIPSEKQKQAGAKTVGNTEEKRS